MIHIIEILLIQFAYCDPHRKIIYNIMSSSRDDFGKMYTDEQNVPVISEACFEYLILSRIYPTLYEKCYLVIIDHFLKQKTIYINLSTSRYINENQKSIISMMRDIINSFLTRNIEYFKVDLAIFSIRLQESLESTMQTLYYKVRADILIDNKTLFIMLNDIVSALIYKSISVLLKHAKLNNDLNMIDNIRCFDASEHIIKKYTNGARRIGEKFTQFDKFNEQNIKAYAIECATEDRLSILHLELNITYYLMEHILFCMKSYKKDYIDKNGKNTTFSEYLRIKLYPKLELVLNKISKCINDRFGDNIAVTPTKSVKIQSFYIVFDMQIAFHFIRHYHHYSENLESIKDVLRCICIKVDSNKSKLKKKDCRISDKILHIGGSFNRVAKLYSSNLFFRGFKWKIHNITHDYKNSKKNILVLHRCIYVVTHCVISIDLNGYTFVDYDRLKKIKPMTMTKSFEHNVANLYPSNISSILNLSSEEYKALKDAFVSLQNIILIRCMLRCNYLPLGPNFLVKYSKDFENYIALRKVISQDSDADESCRCEKVLSLLNPEVLSKVLSIDPNKTNNTTEQNLIVNNKNQFSKNRKRRRRFAIN